MIKNSANNFAYVNMSCTFVAHFTSQQLTNVNNTENIYKENSIISNWIHKFTNLKTTAQTDIPVRFSEILSMVGLRPTYFCHSSISPKISDSNANIKYLFMWSLNIWLDFRSWNRSLEHTPLWNWDRVKSYMSIRVEIYGILWYISSKYLMCTMFSRFLCDSRFWVNSLYKGQVY